MRARDPWKLALASVLGAAVAVPIAAANPPPPTFCEVNPDQCHRLNGPTRAHFLGLLRQAVRALPKVPGYRCQSEGREIDVTGYGSTARRAAPVETYENIWCFHRGTDARKRVPDVTMNVSLSMLAASLKDGGELDKEHDVIIFRTGTELGPRDVAPRSVNFLFGKIREWRDPKGVVHRGEDPSTTIRRPVGIYVYNQEEVVTNGPYVVSASVSFGSESQEALDAFERRLDRAAISALMAREAARRKADRQAGPIAGVLLR